MRKQDNFTQELLTELAKDPRGWIKGYVVDNLNPLSNTLYKGYNRLALAGAVARQGYSSNLWATYAQLKKAGIRIKYEETKKPTYICFFNVVVEEDEETGEKKRGGAFLKWFRVFNADQLKNPEELKALAGQNIGAEVPEDYKNVVDIIAKSLGVEIGFGNAAYLAKKIKLPKLENYKETMKNAAEDWLITALHELGHAWLDIKGKNKGFSYAEEEVVVESAAFLTAKYFGINPEELDISNCAAYINGWLKQGNITANKASRLFSMADKVADALVGCYESKAIKDNLKKA